MAKKKIVDEMLLTDKKIFGDNEEHSYTVTCEDGHAVATPTCEELEDFPNSPMRLELTYPKLADLSVYGKEQCLEYRGIYDQPYTSCDFSDVCMKHGKIVKPKAEKKVEKPKTKKKYNVTFYYHTQVVVSVEAEDEDEALDIAEMEVCDEKYNEQIFSNLTEDGDTDVDEVGE